MNTNWVKDIYDMHAKYGVHEVVQTFDAEKLRQFLQFRLSFLEEELNETRVAASGEKLDAEEVVDGLIDLCVVAIGTLDAFGVNAYLAWNAVYEANMNKEVGVKEGRPNPLNMPDLIKPKMETHGFDWIPPSHAGNHGLLTKAFTCDGV
jgi:predicted HAD superfamily Cof-like phosphohydrolase